MDLQNPDFEKIDVFCNVTQKVNNSDLDSEPDSDLNSEPDFGHIKLGWLVSKFGLVDQWALVVRINQDTVIISKPICNSFPLNVE
ncbi:5011_t:CDS:2 [Dentiscutata erythropus]|uniref:5011_t:CDS:1 n=1 Tax=Dentiscutata erythropus TaxID=1348616 RepID=A0A9N9GAL1_9GLOM|nr:5011_t:CDS:2 [Dentiscutata erythropus]